MLTKAVLYTVAVNRRIYIVYIQCLSYSILYILLFLGMVVFVDEFEKRRVKFEPKDRIDYPKDEIFIMLIIFLLFFLAGKETLFYKSLQ